MLAGLEDAEGEGADSIVYYAGRRRGGRWGEVGAMERVGMGT